MSYIPASVQVMTMYNVDLTQPVNTTFLLGKTVPNQTFIGLVTTIEVTSLGAVGTPPSVSIGTVAGSYTDISGAQPLTGLTGPITGLPYQVAQVGAASSSNYASIQAETEIYLQITLVSTVSPCVANITLLGITYGTD